MKVGRPPRKRLITAGLQPLVVILARSTCRQTHVSRDLRHIPWADDRAEVRGTCRMPATVRAIRFEQIDFGFRQDHIPSADDSFRVAMVRQL